VIHLHKCVCYFDVILESERLNEKKSSEGHTGIIGPLCDAHFDVSRGSAGYIRRSFCQNSIG
jgi:hypothetical protein